MSGLVLALFVSAAAAYRRDPEAGRRLQPGRRVPRRAVRHARAGGGARRAGQEEDRSVRPVHLADLRLHARPPALPAAQGPAASAVRRGLALLGQRAARVPARDRRQAAVPAQRQRQAVLHRQAHGQGALAPEARRARRRVARLRRRQGLRRAAAARRRRAAAPRPAGSSRSTASPARSSGAASSRAAASPPRSSPTAGSTSAPRTARSTRWTRATGRARWRFQAGGAVKGGLALADGKLYFGDYGGRVYAIRAVRRPQGLGRRRAPRARSGSGPATSTRRPPSPTAASTSATPTAASTRSTARRAASSPGATAPAATSTPHPPSRRSPAAARSSTRARTTAASTRSTRARAGSVWSRGGNGKISGGATVIGDIVYYADLGKRLTVGLDARTGRKVYEHERGSYNPVVSDGETIFLTGYHVLYALREPTAEVKKAREAAAAARAARNAKERRACTQVAKQVPPRQAEGDPPQRRALRRPQARAAPRRQAARVREGRPQGPQGPEGEDPPLLRALPGAQGPASVGVAVVQDQGVAVRVGEERLVADAAVEDRRRGTPRPAPRARRAASPRRPRGRRSAARRWARTRARTPSTPSAPASGCRSRTRRRACCPSACRTPARARPGRTPPTARCPASPRRRSRRRSRIRSCPDLLDRPAIAIGVGEEREAEAGVTLAPQRPRLAQIEAARDQLRARRVEVAHDELEAVQRAGLPST